MRNSTATSEFFVGLNGFVANPIKILTERGLGDEAPDIGKGKTGPSLDLVPTLRVRFDAVGIDPRDRGGHHTKLQVVDHGLGIPTLAFWLPMSCLSSLKPDSIFHRAP